MSADQVWVGIDLGTQGVRVVAADRDGNVVGSGSAPLTSQRDGDRHEQDPEQWWGAVAAACGAALSQLAAHRIGGVAVDATSGTLLLVDGDARALTPALMYDDGRAGDEAVTANEVGAALWAELGYQRMQPSWGLPKVLRLLREHPDAAATGTVAHQSDVITRRLVGRRVPTDLSNALKTGADLVREQWPFAVMDCLGVPERLLPDLVRPGAVLGQVCASAAEQTGLPAGVAVVAGMTDGCAAQIGAGALTPGSWNSVLGTTLVLKGVTDELLHDPAGAVYSHRAPDGRWLPGGASSTGAGTLAQQFPGRDLAAMDALAGAAGPASAVVYPLAGHGERFPFVAPDARGFALGLPGSEQERYAAVLEGVAYVERLCFDSLDLLGVPSCTDQRRWSRSCDDTA